MRLAEDKNMVHTLAADRPDQPFGERVLPRRGGRNRLVPYARGVQSTFDDGAKDTISIADEVARSLIPGERLCDLMRNPFRCRMSREAAPSRPPLVLR